MKKLALLMAMILTACSNQQEIERAVNPDPNHTHADFAIYVEGEKIDFSDTRFMAGKGNDDHEEHNHTHDTLHLHDEVGHIIHRHKPRQTLGDFLGSIGFELTQTCLKTDGGDQYCNDGGAAWRMYVNGQHVPIDAEYVFEDEDQILLTLAASDAEAAAQLEQMTDDACLYSKTCPERGDPPEENCVADPAVPCVVPLEDL